MKTEMTTPDTYCDMAFQSPDGYGKENPVFIARKWVRERCNSHAALVAALNRLAETLEYFAGEVPPSRDECGAMAKAARAALAKAATSNP